MDVSPGAPETLGTFHYLVLEVQGGSEECRLSELEPLEVREEEVEERLRSLVEGRFAAPGDGAPAPEIFLLRTEIGRRLVVGRLVVDQLNSQIGSEETLVRAVEAALTEVPPESSPPEGHGGHGNEGKRALWLEQLRGVPVLEILTDLPRPSTLAPQVHRAWLEVPPALTCRLSELGAGAGEAGASLEEAVLASFGWLLGRYSGREDLLVGAPSVGGSGEVPLRIRKPASDSPRSLVAALREVRDAAPRALHVEVETLAKALDFPVEPGRRPLLQARFLTPGSSLGGARAARLGASLLNAGAATAGADVELHLMESSGGGTTLRLFLLRNLFHETTGHRLLEHLFCCLHRFADDPDTPLGTFDPSTAAQRHQMTVEWQGARPRREIPLLHEAFEAQAQQIPDAIAVEDGARKLTYRQLEERSRSLALRLRELGTGRENVVGMLMGRSLESAVAMLGILRAGSAYLPLDPEYPQERLELMLADAGVVGVVTTDTLTGRLPSEGLWKLTVDTDTEFRAPEESLAHTGHPDNLAYVIFTSGSTGRPKGVGVTHRSASRLLAWADESLSEGHFSRMLASTSFSFDISIFETFATWGLGGTTVLVVDIFDMHAPSVGSITTLNTVPSVFAAALRSGPPPTSVEDVILVGEALPQSLADAVHQRAPQIRLWNLYGPTEDTVYSTVALIHAGAAKPPAIGRPIAGSGAFLMGSGWHRLPPGVPGELWLGGEGLARGYVNRPALTAERFVPDPFGEPGARLYRTGDLARHRPNGELEYLGRIDHQIKVRGVRIEPGEIVAAMTALPAVEEAVVLVRGEGESARIDAYYVTRDCAPLEGIAADLSTSLPVSLVPSTFTALESMPLTSNGKLDRRALPEPVEASAPRDQAGQRTLLEEQLAAIWGDVLETESVPEPDASFFDLGGTSLQASQVLARAREIFDVDLPRGALFEAASLRELASTVRAAGPRGHRRPPLVASAKEDFGGRRMLSAQQRQLWLFQRSHPGSPVYNILEGFGMQGPLNVERLEQALGMLLERHEVLRTTLLESEGEESDGYGEVQDVGGPPLTVVDLSVLSAQAQRKALQDLERSEGRRSFPLTAAPLCRLTLVRREGRAHDLLLTVHHVAADGWSMSVLRRELGNLYRNGMKAENRLDSLPMSYGDFARWQAKWLRGKEEDALVDFWRRELSDLEPLALPTDRPRPAVLTFRGERLEITSLLASRDLEGLRRVAARNGASLFQLGLTAFQLLLSRWSGERDVAVGVPAAQRGSTELQGLVGYLINLLVLRLGVPTGGSFADLLAENRRRTVAALNHQELPFEILATRAVDYGSPDRNPVFQAMFQLLQGRHQLALEGLVVEPLHRSNGTAKFDVELFLEDDGRILNGYLEYASDLFDTTTMVRFLNHYRRLLEQIPAAIERPLASLGSLSTAESHCLQVELAGSKRALASVDPQPLSLLVEGWAARSPDAPAVIADDRSLTYKELEEKTNRLARLLRSSGVRRDDRVGVCLRRSSSLPVSVLGILKAGAAVLPLDPSYPKARLEVMASDGAPRVVVCSRDLAFQVQELGCRTLVLEEAAVGIAAESSLPLDLASEPSDLAYVLFTSGSTGRPKGVAMPHGPLANLIHWQRTEATPGTGGTTLQFASLNFDVSFQEIFSTWAIGGALRMVSEEVRRDPELLLNLLDEEGIRRIFLPFVTLQALAEEGADRPWPRGLVEVVTAGEQPRLGGAVGRWLRGREGVRLHNQYGPTEAHVTTAWTSEEGLEAAPELPVAGTSITGHRSYVVDRFGNLSGLGGAGELLIGGVGLARGYLGRPGLTAECFVPDPFSGISGSRLYSTSDRMRRLVTGHLEFLGRLDDQVKVRGFRVELREVELALEEHPALSQAAAVVDQEGAPGGRLVGYAVVAPEIRPEELPTVDLKRFVAARLPAYMIPSIIILVEEFPLTPSGKLDYRSLPNPSAARSAVRRSLQTLSPVEEMVLQVWGELFAMDPEEILLEDDFFALGGHSLLAMRLASRLREALEVPCSVSAVLGNPTPAGFARSLRGMSPGIELPILPTEEENSLLSSRQERFLDLQAVDPESGSYVISDAFRFDGEPSFSGLREALETIVRRHEVLRTRFTQVGSRWQLHRDYRLRDLELVVVDVVALPLEVGKPLVRALLNEQGRRPFAPESRAPKLRALVIRRKVSWDLALAFPHFAVDGSSTNLLLQELASLYRSDPHRPIARLPELPLRYRDFAAWEQKVRKAAEKRDLEYWRKRLTGPTSAVLLPTDRPRKEAAAIEGSSCHLTLGAALSSRVQSVARQQGVTVFMVTLLAFGELLRRLSGQRDFVVGVPTAGRHRQEFQDMVGCFVSVLPMRIQGTDEESAGEAMLRIRQQVVADLDHPDIDLEELQKVLAEQDSQSRGPLYQTLFQILGTAARSLTLEGNLGLPLSAAYENTSVESEWVLEDGPNGIEIHAIYRSNLFDDSTLARWTRSLGNLLASLGHSPDLPMAALEVQAPAERHQILLEWNDTGADFGPDRTLVDLLDAAVRRWPSAPAVTFEDETLTYRQLDGKANRLAHQLIGLGVGPEFMVGVLLDRSLDLVVSLVAILKAGGAYVPLDPTLPAERVRGMVADENLGLILSYRRFWGLVEGPAGGVSPRRIDLDELRSSEAKNSVSPRGVKIHPSSPAYALYASGSTGKPEAVVSSHRGIVDRLLWIQQAVGIGPKDRSLQVTRFFFDISGWDFFWPLIAGARLVLAKPEGHEDPEYLLETLRREAITTVHCIPSVLRAILSVDVGAATSLDRVFVGGEALPVDLERDFLAASSAELYTLYSPQEAAVEVTAWRCREQDLRLSVPIGRPIAKMRLRVVDRQGRLVPQCISGELLVAGPGLARGFLGHPALTAERFIPDGAAQTPGERAFRTGDLVRWNGEGTVDLLRRIDDEVNVRGFRIELAEIQRVLAEYPSLEQAVVMVDRPGTPAARLVAFGVPVAGTSPEEIQADDARRFLASRLPAYMVPAAIVLMEKLPLTSSGMLDRRALPVPEEEPDRQRRRGPRTAMEEMVLQAWGELFEMDPGTLDPEEDFFSLGGNSLLAMRLASRLRQMLGVSCSVGDILKSPSPAGVARHLEGLPPAWEEPIPRTEGRVKLSRAQERFLDLQALDTTGTVYIVSDAYRFPGRPSVQRLERALRALAERHDVLVTRFPRSGSQWFQHVDCHVEMFSLVVIELGNLPPAEREAQSEKLLRQAARQPFDPESLAPKLSAWVLRQANDCWDLVLTFPHFAVDGESFEIVHRDLAALYDAPGAADSASLPELAIRYRDFAAWERRTRAATRDRNLEYWRQRLDGMNSPALLPSDRPRSGQSQVEGGQYRLLLGRDLSNRLESLSRRYSVTLFMALLAGFGELLRRLSGQRNLMIGVPVGGRHRRELENLVGCFISVVPMRLDMAPAQTGADLLQDLRGQLLADLGHGDVPLEELAQSVFGGEGRNRASLYETLFQLTPRKTGSFTLGGVEGQPVTQDFESCRVDTEWALESTPNGVEVYVLYRSSLFDLSTLGRWTAAFASLLENLCAAPQAPLGALAAWSQAERHQFLNEWNDTAARYESGDHLHGSLEAAALRWPAVTAVAIEGETLTYGELDARSNRLARYLMSLGVGLESRVGVTLPRSLDLVVALFAILKAGGAYLPLEPTLPASRRRYMLGNSGAAVVLIRREHRELFGSGEEGVPPISWVVLEDAWSTIEALPGDSPEVDVGPSNAAYAIYTSGSTGRPTGVIHSHRGILNRLHCMQAAVGLGPQDRVLQTTPFSFDGSVWEFFWPLMTGARLVLAKPGGHKEPAYLLETIQREGITTIHFVPSMLQVFLGVEIEEATTLKRVIVSGESLPVDLKRRFLKRSRAELYNLYSPQEAAVEVTAWRCREQDHQLSVPIGRPVAKMGLRVVDRQGWLVPQFVSGELLVAGPGLARGFLGHPALTAERFIPDGAAQTPGERAFRTGDLVRWNGEGTVDLLRRIDDEVNVRGFRIELAEIQRVLAEYPSLEQAVVMVDRPGTPAARLVAFGVPVAGTSPEEIQADDARRFLASRLPAYMVPAAIVLMEKLPLTSSGMLDRRALPVPEEEPDRQRRRGPRTAMEEMVLQAWGELFEMDPGTLDPEEDFFSLGGNSLLAMRLASRLRQMLGVSCSVGDILKSPSPAGVARHLEGLPPTWEEPISRTEGEIKLSRVQERFLDLQALDATGTAYIVPDAYRFPGRLSVQRLERALRALAERHDVLLTRFSRSDSRWLQHADCHVEMLSLVVIELGNLPPAEREAQSEKLLRQAARQPFDPESLAPKLSAWVLRQANDCWDLVLTFPHFAVDGESFEIVHRDLAALYDAPGAADSASLPELAIRYQDFAAWERSARAATRDRDLEYWRQRLDGMNSPALLPSDRPRSGRPRSEGGQYRLLLDHDVSNRLEGFARRRGVTLFMVLLAGFGELIRRLSGQRDLIIGVPVAGRHRQELEELVGCFVTVVPMRLAMTPARTGADLLDELRGQVLTDLGHGDVPLEELARSVLGAAGRNRVSLYETLFQLIPPKALHFSLGGVEGQPVTQNLESCRVDTEWALESTPNGVEVYVLYRSSLFDSSTLGRWTAAFASLLENLCAAPQAPLGALAAWSQAERHQFLNEWNDTAARYESGDHLHGSLEAAALRWPAVTAVAIEGETLTYGELDARSNRLARYLMSLGVGLESRVGVTLPRSLDLVVALFAILKAGGAYLPLEPTLPASRRRYMLGNSGAAVVLIRREHRELFGSGEEGVPPISWVVLEDAWSTIEALPGDSPEVDVGPSNAAYAIYTSGSTGRPKGVISSHRGILNRLHWMQSAHGLGPQDRVLQKTPFSFDVSVWEFFWPLMTGARLVLAKPGGHKEPAYLLETIQREGITTIHFVPSMLQVFLGVEIEEATTLKRVIVSGEALPMDLKRRFLERSRAELLNLYGPTEASVEVTAWVCRRDDLRPSVPIGRPIANMGLRVVDPMGRLCPQGVAGELLLRGTGLARGYLDRAGLTAASFVPDGFSEQPGERAYRTGDLVRWSTDGTIEFLGRIDHQVKIRGFRIETGEIEVRLADLDEIQEAVVGTWVPDSGDRRLVAYVVSDVPPSIANLRALLAEHLPEYMIPAHFVFLDELPLSANGKVDRKRLPTPESEGFVRDRPVVDPRTPTEEVLVKIWRKLMEIEEISVLDDFFELGGHSLLAIHLVTDIRDRWDVDLPVATLFGAPTLEMLARVIDDSGLRESSILLPMGGQELDAPPFFCVHGIGGNVFRLVDLARRVGRHRAFYGVQGWAKLDDTSFLSSVDSMAERYLAEIETIYPQGPLFLGGYSLGSMVAYEMARRAAELSREVAFVALLDVSAPEVAASPEEAAEAVQGEGFEGGIAQELGIKVSSEKLAGLDPRGKLAYVLEEGKKTGALPSGFDVSDAFRFIDVYQKTALANHSYGPRPYEGSVTLFSTEVDDGEDQKQGWRALVSGDVEVVPIEGTHYSMVYPPAVDCLARALVEAMERAEKRLALSAAGNYLEERK